MTRDAHSPPAATHTPSSATPDVSPEEPSPEEASQEEASQDDISLEAARGVFHAVAANIERVMVGQSRAVRLTLAAFAAGGHTLLEDAPGAGKTTLAKSLAASFEARFTRAQFTPDLLPADILGVSIYNPADHSFHFHEGPVFTNILLADEINRASPRTQSALLEAMAERQVSIEGENRTLPAPFHVIATQNPADHHGAYPLPESQLDRFAVCFSLGYVAPAQEVAMLQAQMVRHPLETLQPCASLADAVTLQEGTRRVRVSPELARYIVDITTATRRAPGVRLGAGPRASLMLMRVSQALALADGFDFLTPDAVQEAAPVTLPHRLFLEQQAQYAGETALAIITRILEELAPPV